MGTSFVEYKGFGFWTRDSYLESWLQNPLQEMGNLSPREPWQDSLVEHWRIQAEIDGGVMSLDLDKYLTDEGRKDLMLSMTRVALNRCEPLGQRTGELFVRLLQGKPAATVESNRLFRHQGVDRIAGAL